MCIACDLIVNVGVSDLQSLNTNFKINNVTKALIFRFSILIGFTLMLIYFRMYIMDFENPKFKSMDNPIAAAETQTKVCRIFL